MDARAEVAETLRRLSAAWRERRYEELSSLFDENVVMALPGFADRVKGRDALVASYREFMDRATILEYREEPPTVDVWGDSAVAMYRWHMAWAAGGDAERASGHDVFVFTRGSGAEPPWRAVWRTLAVDPPAA